jgi:hypothetical protein
MAQDNGEEAFLPQWSAKELERLESLEKAKKLVLTLCSKGTDICHELDTMVGRQHLINDNHLHIVFF